jgi:hypothetical protein
MLAAIDRRQHYAIEKVVRGDPCSQARPEHRTRLPIQSVEFESLGELFYYGNRSFTFPGFGRLFLPVPDAARNPKGAIMEVGPIKPLDLTTP